MIALRMLMNIHLAEQAEERDPEDEQDGVPYEQKPDARNEGDEVEEGGDGREGGDDFGVDPFPVAVFIFSVCSVEVDAIETADCEGEDELEEAEDGVCDVGEGHFEAVVDTHGSCLFVSWCCKWNCVFIIVVVVVEVWLKSRQECKRLQ